MVAAYVMFFARQHQAAVESGRPFLPDPRRIIPSRHSPSDHRVLSTLTLATWSPRSSGTPHAAVGTTAGMGTRDLSDGTWVWPEDSLTALLPRGTTFHTAASRLPCVGFISLCGGTHDRAVCLFDIAGPAELNLASFYTKVFGWNRSHRPIRPGYHPAAAWAFRPIR
jgi:hypothetical protein